MNLLIKYGIMASAIGIMLDGWTYGKQITIPANQIDADLTNFPMTVYLDNTNFDFTKAKTDGSDIRFTDENLNQLKFERKEHSNVLQKAVYNVLIPTVNNTTDTVFYMWYGNPNAYNTSIEAWQDQTGKQLTYNGNVKLVTGVQAGKRAASFDGTGDYFSIADSEDWNFGSGDFCVEHIVYPTSFSTGQFILGQWNGGGGNESFTLYQRTDGKIQVYDNTGSLNDRGYTSNALTLNAVNRIKLARSGTTTKVYINDVEGLSFTRSSALLNSTLPFTIGTIYNGYPTVSQYYYQGYKFGTRITKGRSRNGEATPTHFEIDGSDVVFCTNFDTIYDQNYAMVQHMGDTLVDATGNGNNGTATGTTVVNTDYGKARNFNGSSDYIQLPAGAIPHSSSPLTILSSFKATSLADNKTLIADIEGRTGEKGSLFQFISNKLRWWYSQSPIGALIGNTTLSINTDYISAISWNGLSGTIIKMLLNGVVDATQTAASANLYSQSTYPFNPRIGMVYGATSYYYSGLIYETRISNSQRSDTWIKAESLGLKNQLLTIEEI